MTTHTSTRTGVSALVLALGLFAFGNQAFADSYRHKSEPAYGTVQTVAMPASTAIVTTDRVPADWQGTPPSHHGQ